MIAFVAMLPIRCFVSVHKLHYLHFGLKACISTLSFQDRFWLAEWLWQRVRSVSQRLFIPCNSFYRPQFDINPSYFLGFSSFLSNSFSISSCCIFVSTHRYRRVHYQFNLSLETASSMRIRVPYRANGGQWHTVQKVRQQLFNASSLMPIAVVGLHFFLSSPSMERVCSTVGSSTSTFWNLLARVLSPSKNISGTLPGGRTNANNLPLTIPVFDDAGSIHGSVAPTCSNQGVDVSDKQDYFSIAEFYIIKQNLRRSSNSPLYLAPAMTAGKS